MSGAADAGTAAARARSGRSSRCGARATGCPATSRGWPRSSARCSTGSRGPATSRCGRRSSNSPSCTSARAARGSSPSCSSWPARPGRRRLPPARADGRASSGPTPRPPSRPPCPGGSATPGPVFRYETPAAGPAPRVPPGRRRAARRGGPAGRRRGDLARRLGLGRGRASRDATIRIGHVGLILEMLGRSGLPRAGSARPWSRCSARPPPRAGASGPRARPGAARRLAPDGRDRRDPARRSSAADDARRRPPVPHARPGRHRPALGARDHPPAAAEVGPRPLLLEVLGRVRDQVHALADLKGRPDDVLDAPRPRLRESLAPDSVAALRGLVATLGRSRRRARPRRARPRVRPGDRVLLADDLRAGRADARRAGRGLRRRPLRRPGPRARAATATTAASASPSAWSGWPGRSMRQGRERRALAARRVSWSPASTPSARPQAVAAGDLCSRDEGRRPCWRPDSGSDEAIALATRWASASDRRRSSAVSIERRSGSAARPATSDWVSSAGLADRRRWPGRRWREEAIAHERRGHRPDPPGLALEGAPLRRDRRASSRRPATRSAAPATASTRRRSPASPRFHVVFMRPTDIVTQVQEGPLPPGRDRHGRLRRARRRGRADARSSIPDLGYGGCRLVVAVPESWIDVGPHHRPGRPDRRVQGGGQDVPRLDQVPRLDAGRTSASGASITTS